MKKLFSLIICSSLYLCNCAQSTEQLMMDSLFQAFETSKLDTQTVDLFNKLTFEKLIRNTINKPDSAILLQEKNIALATKLNYGAGLAQALYLMGRFHISGTNNYAKATPYLLESLSLFEELEDKKGCSICHMQLGVISYMLQYYEDAIRNLTQAVEYDENPVAEYLMALSFSELENFPEAKKYFNLSIDHSKETGNTVRLYETYGYIGKLFEKENKLDSAFYYLNLAIDGVQMNGAQKELIRPYALISSVYLKSGDVDRAIQFGELSYNFNKSKTDIISRIEALSTLSKAYALKGNYKKAHNYLERYNSINDQYVQGSTKQKVADMQSMFEFKKKINEEKIRSQKDKEIAEERIQKQKILRNAFIIGSLLLLLISLILYNRYTIKRNSEIVLTEKNTIIQKEKDRSENLLLNILPAEIAEELKEKGEAVARDFDEVSVLFTDFKEFTRTSEKMSAQELVSEINACFKAFDEIIGKYGIEKIKTIGDAYMAAAGLPVPTDESVKNSLLSALDMQTFISDRKKQRDEAGLPAFEMRVGIHTGPVVAGIVGMKKFQYDIWGDTVNTAARIESNGEVGRVNISQSTYDLIKHEPSFKFENRGKIEAKGKGEIGMFFVQKMDQFSFAK